MLFLTLLGPAALGAAALAVVRADRSERVGFGRILSLAGVLLAVGLAWAVRGDDSWRGTSAHSVAGTVAALGALSAWAVVAGRSASATSAVVGTGLAATGLGVFATNDWLVPALLFWLVGSIGLALPLWREARWQALAAVAGSDALVIGAFWSWWSDARAWSMPAELGGAEAWLLIAAAVLRVGAIPRVGPWTATSGVGGAVLPLQVASGFVLLTRANAEGTVWLASALLALAVIGALWAAAPERPRLQAIAPPPVALLLACALIAPSAVARAGTAAALTVALAALWPAALGRAQPERGLVLALLPLTVGFGAVVGAALASFSRAVGAQSIVEAAPWAAVAALLPVGLAALVLCAALPGGAREPEGFSASAVLSTWLLVGVTFVLGLVPHGPLSPGALSDQTGRVPWLFLIALLAGAVAARVRLVRAVAPMIRRTPGPDHSPPREPRFARIALAALTVAGAVAAVAAVSYVTVMGLRVGFL